MPTPSPHLQPSSQPMQCSSSRRWSFIEQWRQAVAFDDDKSVPATQIDSTSKRDGDHGLKRKRVASPAVLAGATPPPSRTSMSSQRRTGGGSPSKKRKLPDRSARSRDDNDDPFIQQASPTAEADAEPEPDPDPDPTPRRGIPGNHPPPSASIVGSPFTTAPSIASSLATTSNTSRARSLSPTKKTQNLVALKKPIHYIALEDNATDQLPADVRGLYNRLYDITVEHEDIFPWQARDEIIQAAGRRFKDSWFYGRDDRTHTSTVGESDEPARHHRAAAVAELAALRELEVAASECRDQGRSEAAWNLEVHGPLLQLGLANHKYVRRELITTAQITKAFLPPMGDYAVADYADKKMVDFALVLDPGGPSRRRQESQSRWRDGGDVPPAGDAVRDQRLADAIRRTVYGQPLGRQSVNQTSYVAISLKPIAVSIETKADGASGEGRAQLAIWAAAWHERMRQFLAADSGSSSVSRRVVTLPVVLVVEHAWVLSFVCDRGDRLEVVGDMPLGDTRSLAGLYTLVAVVREIGHWVDGPFREWIGELFQGGDGVV